MNRVAVVETSLNIEEPALVMLACELHAGPCQHLMAAFCHMEAFRHLQATEPENAGKEFYQGFTALRRGIEDLRALLRELRPLQIQGITLIKGIEDLIQEHAARHGLLVTFSHSPRDIELPSVLRTAVFRIIQEGLANVRRHGRTRSVRLGIVQREDSVRIEIEDWGIGFNPNNVGQDRFGIAGIQARVAMLGGETHITSGPGKGTLLVVDLPMSPFVQQQSHRTVDAELPHDELSSPRVG